MGIPERIAVIDVCNGGAKKDKRVAKPYPIPEGSYKKSYHVGKQNQLRHGEKLWIFNANLSKVRSL